MWRFLPGCEPPPPKKVKVRKISPKVLKIKKPSFFYNDFYDKYKEIIAVYFIFLDK